MGIIEFIVIVCVIGFIVYLVQQYAPIPEQFKTIILWAAVFVVLIILLKAIGVIGMDWQIPRVRG